MEEPVTLAETKRHLRLEVDETDEDSDILDLIADAREYAEGRQRKKLAVRSFTLTAAAERSFILPPPCKKIISVVVTDKDGQAKAIDEGNYHLYSDDFKAVLVLGKSYKYPSLNSDNRYPVQIEFSSGMLPVEVPRKTKRAIKLLIGHWYETREATTEKKREKPPFAVDALLEMDRTW
ncbi:head-tail connector protein [Paenibacillus odorifer]|uniref:head-tail connector protein n=2 Tax=Paenibacillus TaxID=44249 RepID=UPI0015C40CB1|nr:head-tail connector protein [Paenibacillus odorifer]